MYLRHLRSLLNMCAHNVSWARCTCAGNVAADVRLAIVSELFILELALRFFHKRICVSVYCARISS